MKKFTSNYVYSQETGLIRFGVIQVDENVGLKVIDTGGEMKEIASLEFHSGILIVGEISEMNFASLLNEKSSFEDLFKLIDNERNTVSLLSNIDFENKCLKQDSRLKRIL